MNINIFPKTTKTFIKGTTRIFPTIKFNDTSLKYNIIIGNVNICALNEIAIVFLIELGNLYNFLFKSLLNNIIHKVAKNESTYPRL